MKILVEGGLLKVTLHGQRDGAALREAIGKATKVGLDGQSLTAINQFLIEPHAIHHGIHHLTGCKLLCQIGMALSARNAVALIVGRNDNTTGNEVAGAV